MSKAQRRKASKGVTPVIYFYSTGGYFGMFSNFSRHKITIDGQVYPTTEHYYQSEKYRGVNEARRLAVIKAYAPSDAAFMTRDDKFPIRADWDEVKDTVMMTALRAKFMDRDWCTYVLARTGKAELLEDTTGDTYWGIGTDGTGQNKLGRMLMQIRKELAAAGITPDTAESLLVAPKPGQKEKEEIEFTRCFKESATRRKEISDALYKNPVERLEALAKNPTKYITPLYPAYNGYPALPAPVGPPNGGYKGFAQMYDAHKGDHVSAALSGVAFKDADIAAQQRAFETAFALKKKSEGVETHDTGGVATAEAVSFDRDRAAAPEPDDMDDEDYQAQELSDLAIPLYGETIETDFSFRHTFTPHGTHFKDGEIYCLAGGLKGRPMVEYCMNGQPGVQDEIQPGWFITQNPAYAHELVTALTAYTRWLSQTISDHMFD